jgi:hypothetical protein
MVGNEMNVRQQLYKQNILKGMSKYAAARSAGYSHSTALNCKENIEKRGNMAFWLEAHGITDKALAAHVNAGLEAERPVVVSIGKNEQAVQMAPDWATRHRYCETALKVTGRLKDGNVVIDQSKHTHYSLTQLARDIAAERQNGIDSGATEDPSESDLRQTREILGASLGREPLVEADRNHALSSGQSENDSPKQ